MKLDKLIRLEITFCLPPIDSCEQLLGELSRQIAESVEGIDAAEMEAALIEREKKGATSTPEAVAFPHAMLEGVKESFVAAALVNGGVSMGKKEHPKCDVIFVLVGPPSSAWEHVRILARLARVCHTPGALDHMRCAKSSDELCTRILAEDARHV